MKRILLFAFILSTVLACSRKDERFTEDGYKYIVHVDSGGRKPQLGDYVTIELVYKTEDTVLLDTRKEGPYRFKLDHIPFKGSFESDLLLMGKGDSATFYVPADSLYKHLFVKNGVVSIPQSETPLKKGSFVMYDIKLVNVQDYVEAEQEMMLRESEMEKKEAEILSQFIVKNKIKETPDSRGIYKVQSLSGKGREADSLSTLSVFFRGRLMSGKIFNLTQKDKPYSFILGKKDVIDGWEYSMLGAREGDRFTLIIPSKHGYGAEGMIDTKTGEYIVPPYSTLVFDIIVLEIKDPSVAVK